MFYRLILLAGVFFIMTTMPAIAASKIAIEISTKGTVVIDLLPELAPLHVAQITTLVKDGFYNGVIFHRVIEGFMAQTGDPTGTGMGGSNLPNIKSEFSSYPYKRGTVGMARSNDPNSANSQFFICFTDTGCNFLTGDYTVVGQVSSGMEFVDKIARGEPPSKPDTMVKVTIVE